MRTLLLIWAVGLFAFGGQTGAAAAPADWATKPSMDELLAAYPPLAVSMGVEGYVTIQCTLSKTGVIEGCKVVGESPKGLGFGDATLSITHLFRMKPGTGLDALIGDRQVRIPISFRLPPMTTELPVIAPPLSADALVQARRLIAARHIAEAMRTSGDRELAILAGKPSPGVAPDVREDALAAIRQGYEETTADVAEVMARVFAARVSAADTAAAVAFETGPIAKALNAHSAELAASSQRFVTGYGAYLVTDAHARFCRDHDCVNAMEPAPAEPDWIEDPSLAQRTLSMPLMATTFFVGGHADLVCEGTRIGLIKSCRISHESPPGMGFGPAAQRLSSYYRMAPTKDGAPVPLRVDYSMLAPPALPPHAPTNHDPAFEKARQISRLMGMVMVTPKSLHWGDGLIEEPLAGVSDKTRSEAIKVVDDEIALLQDAVADQVAAILVANLDEAQLNDLLAYVRTEAYQAKEAAARDLAQVSMTLARTFGARAMFAAHQKFCAKRDCTTPPPIPPGELDRLKAALPHLERVAPRP